MRVRETIAVVVLLAQVPTVHGEGTSISIVYDYGVHGRNKLDTISGTYTKDMVVDPSVTVKLTLTNEERDTILAEARAVGFFELPSQIVPPDTTELGCLGTPCGEELLRITVNSTSHTVKWDDCNCSPSSERDRADRVGRLIQKIIESKPEYKKLPKPRGGYI